MPLIEELKNGLNVDGVSNDFGTWNVYPKVTSNIG
jgi:hypothetical protein